MPAVLGQIGFVGAVVVHGPLWVIERDAGGISFIRNALECKLAAPLVRSTPRRAQSRLGAIWGRLCGVGHPRFGPLSAAVPDAHPDGTRSSAVRSMQFGGSCRAWPGRCGSRCVGQAAGPQPCLPVRLFSVLAVGG
jgi:hypothetical protein